MTRLKLGTVGRRWLFEFQTLAMAIALVMVIVCITAFICGAAYVVWHAVFAIVTGVVR